MKARKKMTSILLSIMLIISCFPAAVFAEEAADLQDEPVSGDTAGKDDEEERYLEKEEKRQNDIADDSVNESDVNELIDNNEQKGDKLLKAKSDGKGTSQDGNAIEISTPEDLNAVRNNLSGNYVLANDIDLTSSTSEGGEYYNKGKGWEPIGDDDDFFEGTFDGNGYKVSGLNSSGYQYTSLFATNGGTIKNLTVEGSLNGSATDYADVAGVAGFNAGDVQNCTNNAAVKIEANGNQCYCAGVVGYNLGAVTDCVNNGTIEAASSSSTGVDGVYTGGVVAYSDGTVSGENTGSVSCIVKAEDQIALAGGIVGFNLGNISDSANTGDIYAKSFKDATDAGGIVGLGLGTIDECTNSGSVQADNNNTDFPVTCGGIIGEYLFIESESENDDEIVDCSNSGNISAKGKEVVNIGGIAGKLANAKCLVSTCSNTGSVTGDVYNDVFDNQAMAGGIVGFSRGAVYRSYNLGKVKTNGFRNNFGSSGGIAGYQKEGAVTQCYNRGSIDGFLFSAGISAINHGTVTNCYNTGTVQGSDKAGHMGGIVGGNHGKVGFVYNTGLIKPSPRGESNGIIGYNGATCSDNVYNLNWQGYTTDDRIGSRCSYAQMKKSATYDGFNFKSIWTLGAGKYRLPVLRSCADSDLQSENQINCSRAPFKASDTTYTGKVRKPAVVLSGLTAGTDFTVTYSDNINVGTGKATVTGQGVFTGTRTVSFKINPKTTAISKIIPASRGFTVKWRRGSDNTGYQIQYALNSKFTSGRKTVNVAKASAVSYKITKLRAKKRYYVKVRTYKTCKGTKYYSTWSKAKSVITK